MKRQGSETTEQVKGEQPAGELETGLTEQTEGT